MKKVDYIIVGSGLAGIFFAAVLISNHQSFIVIDDVSQHSSECDVVLYNHVILNRFTPVFSDKEQLYCAQY